jgi:hypothetical protein
LHASQVPAQAPLQQVPSAQEPLVHMRARLQTAPLASAAVQVPALQKVPVAHSVSAAQLVWQAVAPELQPYGAQLEVALAQDPAPSQRGVESVAPAQIGEPHEPPLGGNVQAPAPLHAPPQAPEPKHSSAGSCPAGIAVQAPAEPITLQAWQAPPHAAAQQTPSVQKPLAHWDARTQALPLARSGTQLPPAQCALAAHSESVAQLEAQALVEAQP